jgi:acetyl/propionyl-CoA carboxylase alpha subunit
VTREMQTVPQEPATLLIANRGEIAVRIIRAAATLGMRTVAVHSEDDANQMHVRLADSASALRGVGPAPYLDVEQLLAAAIAQQCSLVHPGYGFLSESHRFAQACVDAGIKFVGPSPSVLETFGEKASARRHAERCGVPVLPGTLSGVTLSEATAFLLSLSAPRAVFVKAALGGGGRGMRTASTESELAEAYRLCRAEARLAFGDDSVYVEAVLQDARHIEVQVVGDGTGGVTHLWDRDCSLQHRNQKIVELAPSPNLPAAGRDLLLADAVRMASAVSLEGLTTFEFLVQAGASDGSFRYYFLEANPRIQVEHTVTEQVIHRDLVRLQLRIAMGASLADERLTQDLVPPPDGYAIEARVTAEEIRADALPSPTAGTVTSLALPSGPAVRVDTHVFEGFRTAGLFDPLLAKLVVHDEDSLSIAVDSLRRALSQMQVRGLTTNLAFLQSLLARPEMVSGPVTTRFVDDNWEALVESSRAFLPQHAVRSEADESEDADDAGGSKAVLALMPGVVTHIATSAGDSVVMGQQLLILEAMKMELVFPAPFSGRIESVAVRVGDVVAKDQVLMVIDQDLGDSARRSESLEEVDLEYIRPDLAAVLERHAAVLDANRPSAVRRRHEAGGRTARENVDRLCDAGSFVEIGPLVVAAQRQRRSPEELRERSPADGLVAGIAGINGELFGEDAARCAVMAYDYTVFAGTQGVMNHRKTDRLFEYAQERQLPLVIFAEGGGGRPGDTDRTPGTTFEPRAFTLMTHMSGVVPMVGVVAGKCFAGNAVMLGLCDVIIATKDARIGLGGPAMIEAGGLGVVDADAIGPVSVQAPNGVIDLVVEDEAEAADAARKYLSYFQGNVAKWKCADQRMLRHVIPENRRRMYDVRRVIDTIADTGSVLELRREFGIGIISCFIRVAGKPIGLLANNPRHLGGAIDADAGDKAARFIQLCDAFGLPLVSLIDNPGFMVGPELETTAAVRHVSRMVMAGGNMTAPHCTIVLRKAYGLGTLAMYGGRSKNTIFNIAWPTAEFGPMALEGAVRLAYRHELSLIEDETSRQERYEELLAREYDKGKALNASSVFEVDDVIDPADTRTWIMKMLPERTMGARPPRNRYIDTW